MGLSSGNSLITLYKVCAGTLVEPSESILFILILSKIVISISVADIFNLPCLASSKTFAKIGIVDFPSTIF